MYWIYLDTTISVEFFTNYFIHNTFNIYNLQINKVSVGISFPCITNNLILYVVILIIVFTTKSNGFKQYGKPMDPREIILKNMEQNLFGYYRLLSIPAPLPILPNNKQISFFTYLRSLFPDEFSPV